MVEDLLKILDRLIQLKEYRDKRLKSVIESLIRPSFEELKIIHENYLDIFRETRDHLSNSLNDYNSDSSCVLWEAKTSIERRRVEFEPVRTKLRLLLAELDKLCFTEELNSLIDSLVGYFPTGSLHETDPYDEEMGSLENTMRTAARTAVTGRSPSLHLSGQISTLIYRVMGKTERDFVDIRKGLRLIDRTIGIQTNRWTKVCAAYAELQVALEAGHYAIREKTDKRFLRFLKKLNPAKWISVFFDDLSSLTYLDKKILFIALFFYSIVGLTIGGIVWLVILVIKLIF